MTSYGFTVGIAWIFGLFMLMSAQNSLSKEKQLGCELFYKCQPVSIWENTASKYIMHVLANSVALLAVGLIFAVIIAIVTSISYGSFNIMNTVFGAFLGSITYLKICLIFGSLFFLFSAVFNGNSFLKGLGALGLLEGVIAIVDAIFNETLNLPSVFQTLFAMTGTMNLEFIDSITVSRVLGGWGILINLIFAGICYTAATLLYEKKQVETSVSI